MSENAKQSSQTPRLIIFEEETYDEAVKRTINLKDQEIKKLQEKLKASTYWKGNLLMLIGFVITLVLVSIQ